VITCEDIQNKKAKIAVVGLGYVGLPLAAAFGRKVEVIGFDTSKEKIRQLRDGYDATGELTGADLASTHIDYADDAACLAGASFLIVTVPTPIDDHKKPDLSPIEAASRSIGRHLAAGSIVVYESTVYPSRAGVGIALWY